MSRSVDGVYQYRVALLRGERNAGRVQDEMPTGTRVDVAQEKHHRDDVTARALGLQRLHTRAHVRARLVKGLVLEQSRKQDVMFGFAACRKSEATVDGVNVVIIHTEHDNMRMVPSKIELHVGAERYYVDDTLALCERKKV